MKVLVTGATGFVGSHLVCRLAEEGYEIRALVRSSSNISHLSRHSVEIAHGDLRDRDSLKRALEGVEAVFHAGAAMQGSWQEQRETTIQGTEWMLQLSLAAGVERFVHISSVAVYGVYYLPRNARIREDCPLEKAPERLGPYAYSKVEAEKRALRYHKRGLPVVVVRPGLLYGPGGRVMFPHVGYSLGHGLFALMGRGDSLLPLTYIDNLIDALMLAFPRKEAIGQVYNVVDDWEITQREYLQRYLAATRTKALVFPLPLIGLSALGVPLSFLRSTGILRKAPGFSHYSLASKWKSLRFDSTRARTDLNWLPRVNLEEGLRRTFAWYSAGGNRQVPGQQVRAREQLDGTG